MKTASTVSELFVSAIERFRGRVAFARFVRGGAEPWASFDELGTAVSRLRRRLPGTDGPIGILLDNGPEWAVAFLAIVTAGRPAVLVDAELAPALLVAQLRHAGARAAVTTSERRLLLAEAWQNTAPNAECCEFIVFEPARDDVSDRPESAPLGRAVNAADPAVIVYTSGSTGAPKGVVLSHRAVALAAARVAAAADMQSEFVTLSLAPMSHAAGLHALLTVFVVGGQLLFLETKKPGAILQALRSGGVTHLLAPPIFYEAMTQRIVERIGELPRPARSVLKASLSGLTFAAARAPNLTARLARSLMLPVRREVGPELKTVFSAGAPLKPHVARTLLALGFDIRDAYGLTETAGVICIAQRRFSLRPGRIGAPLPGTVLRLVTASVDEPGELWVRSDQNMLGYHDAPELTREVLVNGWLRTGDICHIDKRGWVRVCSRAKDIILMSNGKNVYPEDIEACFAGVEGVGDICALGVPTNDGGEVIGLAVVSDLVENELSALRDRLASRNGALASQQRVQQFFIRTEPLPRTPLRKVQRHVLLKQLVRSDAHASQHEGSRA